MYYKIENTESKVYTKLKKLLEYEQEIEAENEKLVQQKVVHEYTGFLGYKGQTNFYRVSRYLGFKFKQPELVDENIWKKHQIHKDVFVPNRKTKAGKEIYNFLHNGLEVSDYMTVCEILKIEAIGKFYFPSLYFVDDVIIMFLDDKANPKVKELIEITSKEFNQYLKKIDKKKGAKA